MKKVIHIVSTDNYKSVDTATDILEAAKLLLMWEQMYPKIKFVLHREYK